MKEIFNFAHIVNGIVVNTIVADEDFISAHSNEYNMFIKYEGQENFNIGCTWTKELGFQKTQEMIDYENYLYNSPDETLNLEIEEYLAGE